MKGMLTLKENLTEEDNKISTNQTSAEQEILELKKQVEWLKKGNCALRNSCSVDKRKKLKVERRSEIRFRYFDRHENRNLIYSNKRF